MNTNAFEIIKDQGLEAFLNYASIGIILVDKNGMILIANKFASNLFGYEEIELEQNNLEILIPNRYKSKHEDHHRKYYEDPQSRPMGAGLDLFGVKKNGTEFPVEISLGTYKIEDDTYVIAFINDISMRKQNEYAIKNLNSELEKKVHERTEALADAIVKLQKQIKETEDAKKELATLLAKEKELNELKSRFVSMASHEFRTPLSTILSSSYLLQQYATTEDQPKREKHLDRILSAVHSLDDILEDLLSVGKIEEGKINVKWDIQNLKELIESVVHQFVPIVNKGQKILYNHTGGELVNTDKSLIKHTVTNLLSNAVKFSPDYSVIKIETNVTNDKWEIRISDQGLGIPLNEQKSLFDRFFRATNVSTIKGTGLGLHIVSKYVELLKGSISFESVENQGTTFIIQFKISK